MRIAVLGTGVVGKTLAAGLSGLGHQVMIGTRDVAASMARTDPDVFGGAPIKDWLPSHPHVDIATFGAAVDSAELVINATNGSASLTALDLAGPGRLSGKIILDLANVLDFSNGFPPRVLAADNDSLAEQIQRAFPRARVVKALNTMNAYLITNPKQLADGDHTVFVSGDDTDAKAVVSLLLGELGWSDVLDLGDLTSARATEMTMALFTRLWSSLGVQNVNIKVVR